MKIFKLINTKVKIKTQITQIKKVKLLFARG